LFFQKEAFESFQENDLVEIERYTNSQLPPGHRKALQVIFSKSKIQWNSEKARKRRRCIGNLLREPALRELIGDNPIVFEENGNHYHRCSICAADIAFRPTNDRADVIAKHYATHTPNKNFQ
jgi:hypothetical protein